MLRKFSRLRARMLLHVAKNYLIRLFALNYGRCSQKGTPPKKKKLFWNYEKEKKGKEKEEKKEKKKAAGSACSLVSRTNWRAICSQQSGNHGSRVTPACGVRKFAPTSLDNFASAQVAGGRGWRQRRPECEHRFFPNSICFPHPWSCPRSPSAASRGDRSGPFTHNKRALLLLLPPPRAAPTLASRGRPGPRPRQELAPGPEVSRYPEGGGG